LTTVITLRTRARIYSKNLLDFIHFFSVKRHKRKLDNLLSLAELLPELCRFQGRGTIFANQDCEELAALCRKLLTKPPRIVIEIGTAKGGTLYLWTRVCSSGALVISLDMPGEIGSVGKPTLSVYRTFGQERGVRVSTLSVDSHSEDAHRKLRELLSGEKADFLFIDGDHRLEGVRADFLGYLQYMSAQGIIALHDIAVPISSEIEVARFWSELQDQQQRTTESLIAHTGKSPGIGVVLLHECAVIGADSPSLIEGSGN
jgi:predicted O-methyltransferase YrrM